MNGRSDSSNEGLNALELELRRQGADIIRYADLSSLSEEMNRGFNKAILIGILLSNEYILNLYNAIDPGSDEFGKKEHQADQLAEWTAGYLQELGYHAFAQSEEELWQHGYFDTDTKSSALPHKTIALLAGLGWIGKNNLLVTPDYGCGFCMCTVLTDAPFDINRPSLVSPKCGGCDICKEICPANAISGNVWSKNGHRDMLVDVFRCECCLKCLAHCPWTVGYAKQGMD